MAKIKVKVPSLGESVSEGVIAGWRKADGAQVERDEILLDLETDKAVMEIPAETSGKLSIKVGEGETVQVGDVIGEIDEDAKGSSGGEKRDGKAEKAVRGDDGGKSGKRDDAGKGGKGAAASLSPAVRKLVAEHDLDADAIDGTGKDGRVTKGDVLAYLDSGDADQSTQSSVPSPESKPAPAPKSESKPAPKVPQISRGDEGPATERVKMSTLRRRIADRLVEAQRTAAILTTFNEIDMSAAKQLRRDYGEAFEKRHGVRLGYMSIFARACVEALKQYRDVNAQIDGDEIVYHNHVHLGIAVGTPRGLMVPVVRDADAMSIAELEQGIGAMATKARDGKITPDDLSGGTFTISNGGVYGSLLSTPILNPPQTGILGMHKIEDRAVVINGEVVVRPMMYVALSYDHRLIDGEQAVRFLVRVKDVVENPVRALIDA